MDRISSDEALELSNQAIVVVLLFFQEKGISKLLFKACVKAKSIMATVTFCCSEIVFYGHNNFLIPIKDSDKLIKCMTRFIQQPQMIFKMDVRNRKRVEKFSGNILI